MSPTFEELTVGQEIGTRSIDVTRQDLVKQMQEIFYYDRLDRIYANDGGVSNDNYVWIAPLFFSSTIFAATSRVQRNTPVRLRLTTLFHSASE